MFEFIRKLLCPFDKLEPLVPQKGNILDVGCGHGTFTEILAKGHPGRNILGIDPSKDKIKIAKLKEKKYKNVKFAAIYLEQVNNMKFDSIVSLDVEYLFTNKQKVIFFKKMAEYLKKNGTILIKTSSTEPKILFKLLQIEETIMVKLLRYTYSQKGKFYISDRTTYHKLFRKAGLKLKKEFIFRSTFPYLHPTYILTK